MKVFHPFHRLDTGNAVIKVSDNEEEVSWRSLLVQVVVYSQASELFKGANSMQPFQLLPFSRALAKPVISVCENLISYGERKKKATTQTHHHQQRK